MDHLLSRITFLCSYASHNMAIIAQKQAHKLVFYKRHTVSVTYTQSLCYSEEPAQCDPQ
jgi:hypothetical protein